MAFPTFEELQNVKKANPAVVEAAQNKAFPEDVAQKLIKDGHQDIVNAIKSCYDQNRKMLEAKDEKEYQEVIEQGKKDTCKVQREQDFTKTLQIKMMKTVRNRQVEYR